MTALNRLVSSMVAVADRVTKTLQVDVQHYAWIRSNARGDATFPQDYAAPVTRQCLADLTPTWIKSTEQGGHSMVLCKAKLLFLEPVPEAAGERRKEAIDPRDVFILPDGRRAPIIQINGPLEPSTGAPYYFEVLLG